MQLSDQLQALATLPAEKVLYGDQVGLQTFSLLRDHVNVILLNDLKKLMTLH
jgi:hypothetical protein